MAGIIQVTDFEGFFNIAQDSYDRVDLQSFIDRNEDFYLCELFGNELKELFVADLTVVGSDGSVTPGSAIYQKIFEPFCVQDSGVFCDPYQSRGIKDILLGLIYNDYIKDQQIQNSVTGSVVFTNENSKTISFRAMHRVGEKRYNSSIASWKSIRRYICENQDTYPEYSGIDKSFSFMDWI